MCIRKQALASLREQAKWDIFMGLGFDVAAFFALLASRIDFGAILGGIITILEAAIDALSALSSIYPDSAAQYQSIQSTASGFLGAAGGLLAAITRMGAWAIWMFSAAFAALKFGALGFTQLVVPLIIAAGAFLIDALGAAYTARGWHTISEASAQESMPIWDWCGPTGPGAGQCPAEPNGGMPESGRP